MYPALYNVIEIFIRDFYEAFSSKARCILRYHLELVLLIIIQFVGPREKEMRKFISAITPIASNGGSRCSRGFSAAASSNVFTPREFVHKGDFESYLAGSFLPSSARDSFFAMRALNIEVASVRDAARGNKVAGHLRMGFWKDFVDKVYRVANATEKGVPVAPEDKIAHPLFEPVLKSVLSHRHTRRWLDRMIDARDKDIDGIPFKTMDDLELYSEHTATSMLYLTLEALGVRDVQADHAGK